ncbi:MAG: hypothetical protein RL065_740, partial [Bacteroidota bacterium]
NSNAAIFSPERAEHEFYKINVTVPIAQKGNIMINEFLAKNASFGVNELGSHEDWIEVYNTTSSPLSLNGLYLTDDRTNPTKYSFPSSTTINANDILIVFADNGTNSTTYLHANFKLSGSADFLMLSNGTSSFDSIAFNNQTTDVSMARCPDGTGSFKLGWPTFKKLNCANGVDEMLDNNKLIVYPNPANQYLIVSSKYSVNTIEIANVVGQVCISIINHTSEIINIEYLPSGIYFIKATDEKGNQFNSKFIKQ